MSSSSSSLTAENLYANAAWSYSSRTLDPVPPVTPGCGCTTRFDTPGTPSCPKDWPVLELQQNLPQTVTVALVDNYGNPISTPTSDASSRSSLIVELTPSFSFVFDASDVYPQYLVLWFGDLAGDTAHRRGVYGNVITPGTGLFSFDFTAEVLNRAGLFVGDIMVFSTEGVLIYSKRIYVEVAPNLTGSPLSRGCLSISEIRLAMRDACPDDNYLLDEVECTNREIAYAIQRPIDFWNEETPDLDFARYSASDFPYRWHWTEAAVGELLKILILNLTRNRMMSQGGGMALDDKGPRAQAYMELAKERHQVWADWVHRKKIELNVMGGITYSPGAWV